MIRRWIYAIGFALGSVSLILGPAVLRTQAEDWPQFRGQNASGVSTSASPLPVSFSTQSNVAWSVELGDSVASPVICQGRVYTTAMVGERTLGVFCFDAKTGAKLWQRELATGELPRITPPNSHAAATPACDGKRVYIHFSTLGLIALDVNSGEQVWHYPLPTPAYLMDWGSAASPIVYNEVVYFNQDDDLDPTLFAVDAATGKLRWRVARPEMLAGYSIPVICEAGGRTDLVVAGTGKLKGYDPQTGREVWSCHTLPRTMMTSPVVRDGVIYLSVQSYGDESRTLKFALLEWLDTNQDTILERKEVPKEFWKRFDQSDKNQDGKLAEGELDTAFQAADNQVGGGSLIQAVRGGGTGDVTKTHVVWNLKNRSPSNLSSPLVVGQQLFVVKKGGLSSSFDTVSGETLWQLKRIQNLGDYFGSPVAGDGKIYVPGENGFMVVLAQGPNLEVLARNDMGESCLASPAIAEGRIYIRTRHHLYCIANQP